MKGKGLPRLLGAIALSLLQLGVGDAAADEKAAMRRGLKVYVEVCAACHGIDRLRFSDLARPGGPELTSADLDYVIGQFRSPAGQGKERPATPDHAIPSPFPTPEEARKMFGGMLPVDLGTLGRPQLTDEERRQFLLGLLLGYRDPPAGRKVPPDRYYNVGAPGQSTGMPPPLADGMVVYWDQTPTTVEQYAADVAAFLVWAGRASGPGR